MLCVFYLGVSYGLYQAGLWKGPIISRVLERIQPNEYGYVDGEFVLLEKPLWAENYVDAKGLDTVGDFSVPNPSTYDADWYDERVEGQSYYRIVGIYDEETGQLSPCKHRWYSTRSGRFRMTNGELRLVNAGALLDDTSREPAFKRDLQP